MSRWGGSLSRWENQQGVGGSVRVRGGRISEEVGRGRKGH